MTNRIKVGDRVIVVAGKYKGMAGTITTRRSTSWWVEFDQKGTTKGAQLLSSQLKRIEVAS
ncbi:MAG: KOW motif-containing protein [Thermomicrobiales bacterium]